MRIQIPEKKKLVYEMTLPIRWGDQDPMGHVNNTSYFRYFETIRIDWFQAVGCMCTPNGEGPVIINAFCNFYRQFEYPGNVLLKLYASDPGRSSFETWITMARTDRPDKIDAEGGATTVWTDFPKQKSAPMPQWLRELIS